MPVKVVGPDSVPSLCLPGREMKRLAVPETMGTENLTVGIMYVQPKGVVSPCHSHDSEEVLYIVDGEGEAYVDGETASFRTGDAVFFPTNSKHMVRNTSDCRELKGLFIFSPHMHPKDYALFEGIAFPD